MAHPIRETARGHDEATPARALAAVTVVIGSIAVLIAALLILWYVLK